MLFYLLNVNRRLFSSLINIAKIEFSINDRRWYFKQPFSGQQQNAKDATCKLIRPTVVMYWATHSISSAFQPWHWKISLMMLPSLAFWPYKKLLTFSSILRPETNLQFRIGIFFVALSIPVVFWQPLIQLRIST